MSLPLPIAYKLTTTPAIQRPIYNPFSKTPKLITNTIFATKFSVTQCKPLSSSSTKSLVPYAVPHSRNETGTLTEKHSDDEKYNLERKVIMRKIEILEGKLQHLRAASTNGKSSSSKLKGILKDSYALGMQVQELESKSSSQTTRTSTTQIFETVLQQFGQASLRSNDGLVIVNPQPNPGPDSDMIDQILKEKVDSYYHREPPSLLQIDGNYAPIRRETPPTNPLPITNGQLPEDLNGMYLRVGPDPVFDPEANYKWLDGDGMLHGVRIENGSAYYVSRYVRNSRYLQEKEFGNAKFYKYGDFEGEYGLFAAYIQILRENVLDMSFGSTTSNVGVVYHAGRVMALEDFGKPYVIFVNGDGDLETLGMNDYNGNLDHNFTPHPKKDPDTGEMFIVGLSQAIEPFVTYRVVAKDGQMRNAVPITVSDPTYLHDFAITENYAIIMDNPYLFSPEAAVAKDTWIFSFDATRKSRFGILPRYATDEREIKWFEFEQPFFVFHTACAWEEDRRNKVILYACSIEPTLNTKTGELDIMPLPFRNFTNNIGGDPGGLTLPEMYRFTFNMSTGEATKELVPNIVNAPVDMPKINEDYMGRKCRYVYTTFFSETALPVGLIKYDLESRQQIVLGGDHTITHSEPVFVPKQSPTAEDDGYLLSFVHYSTANTTELMVLDARTMLRICSIELLTRIPYGFHSIFVSKDELDNQVRPQ